MGVSQAAAAMTTLSAGQSRQAGAKHPYKGAQGSTLMPCDCSLHSARQPTALAIAMSACMSGM